MTAKTATATQPALPSIGLHGKFVILGATALALLATPLASPAMPEIARVFAERAETEAFARMILSMISILPGEANVNFLVKFILLSIPALFILVSAPLTGIICDRFGRKPLLNISLLVFALGGVAGYFADSFLFLFFSRAVLGLSIGGIKTATVAMIGDFFRGDERNKFIGLQGSAMKIGGVIFMLMGGALANYGWQTPFLGYLLAFLLMPSALYAIAESLPEPGSLKKTEPGLIGALPDLPLGPVLLVLTSAVLASAFFFITPVQLPFYLTRKFAASPFEVGAAIALGNTVGALISLAYHRIRQTLNYAAVYSLIFIAMSAGYALLTIVPSYETALFSMVVGGIGFGLYVPNQSAWILAVCSQNRRGLAVGLVTAAMFLGQFAGPIIAVPMVDPGNPDAFWQNVSIILLVLAILYAILARVMRVAKA